MALSSFFLRTLAPALLVSACAGSGGSDDGSSSSTGGSGGSGGGVAGSGAGGSGGTGVGGTAGSGGQGGAAGWPSTTCDVDQAGFDAFAQEVSADLQAKGVPGASLAIVCGGDTVFSTGLGLASTAEGRMVTPQTRFQLASTTKMLTAALGVRLVQEGLLGLDDPVSQWLPFLNTSSPYTESFTFGQLLSHTSGYPVGLETANYSDLEGSFQTNANLPLWAPPGAVFNYSNDGYSLAGLVMQVAAAQPFATLMDTKLFPLAGMTRATMDAQAVLADGDYAVGYDSEGSANLPTDSYYGLPYYGPMGGAWGSAEDLARFAQALMKGGGDLFTPESVAEMTRAHTPTTWGASSYGLGVIINDYSGTVRWRHDGSVGGFLTAFDMVPERGFALAIVVNSDKHFPSIFEDALQRFTGSYLPLPTVDSSYDPQTMGDHVGEYVSNTLGEIKIEQAGGGIEITMQNQTQSLSPLWRDTYAYTAADGFESDAHFWRVNGVVEYVVTPYGVGALGDGDGGG